MFGFNKYLIEENRELKERNRELENRLLELLDARLFNRAPERLTKDEPKQDKKPDEKVMDYSRQSDALSAAEEDAWNRSKPKGGDDE